MHVCACLDGFVVRRGAGQTIAVNSSGDRIVVQRTPTCCMGGAESKCCRSARALDPEEAPGEDKVIAISDESMASSALPQRARALAVAAQQPVPHERFTGTTPRPDQAEEVKVPNITWREAPVTVQDGTEVSAEKATASSETIQRRTSKMATTASAASRFQLRSDTFESHQSQDDKEEEDVNEDHLIDNLVSSALKHDDHRRSMPFTLNARGSVMAKGDSDVSDDHEDERRMVKMLFTTPDGHLVQELEPRFQSISRIVAQLFVQEEAVISCVSTYSSKSIITSMSESASICCKSARSLAAKIIKNSCFIAFFMLLTFYAIFGPDLVILLLDKGSDFEFQIVNTAVFFLFGTELFLTCVGKQHYVCTVTFILDLVAVMSILSDTYLLQAVTVDQDGARVSRMARSSRMTRLARIVRVARVTRLLPRLLHMCGTQQQNLGKNLLDKRLWRSFLYMASERHKHVIMDECRSNATRAPSKKGTLDHDEKIDYVDVKVFYWSILSEVQHMISLSKDELLKADLKTLCADEDGTKLLDFYQFRTLFYSTATGKSLISYHVGDVEREDGVWSLTQKLSDNIALKVCIGLLILIGVMAILEDDVRDDGPEQALMQMDLMAREQTPGFDTGSYLCDQIRIFALQYVVMYVYLDGKTYWDQGVCHPAGIDASKLDPWARIKSAIDQAGLRSAEVVQSCWPDNENCGKESSRSISLVDSSKQNDKITTGSLLTTSIVIALLLVFVYVLNLGITSFSKTLLQPLRALVDDMAAMSQLELVNIDRDMPGTEIGKPQQVVEELRQLQESCTSMRGAIKSWSRYVPPAVVQRLYTSGVEAKIGVARTNVTILFCDIAGFEEKCRGLSPEKVLDLLSQVLGRIADVITLQKGTLIEFIGDEVMSVFNAPNTLKTHTQAGVITALEIHELVSALNEGLDDPISCRCGVNTCQILAGNIGSSQRMKYGLLGDGVNLTARLKGINTKYKTRTLASEKVILDPRVSREVIFRPVDLVAVKGKKEPTKVYEPLAVKKAGENSAVEVAASKHTEAFELYKKREFAKAQTLFEEVHRIFELQGAKDEPSRCMKERCSRYLKEPPAADWDGVERLTKK